MHYRLLALLAIPTAVHAAEVDVRVISTAHDTPMANASVCLGTPAVPNQFGAHRTGPEGQVAFQDVPATPLLLTVSKPQHKGERRLLSANQYDRSVSISLRRGGGGPTCSAPVSEELASMGTGLRIANCKINRGAASTSSRIVTLDCAVVGVPAQYRASEIRDFRNVDWRPYELPVRVELTPGQGKKTVYYQVRRSSEASGASLQMVSNIVSDSIHLTDP